MLVPYNPDGSRPADRGARRPQQRRHGAPPDDAATLGHQQRPRLGRQGLAERYAHRVVPQRRASRLPLLPQGLDADPQTMRGRNAANSSQPAAAARPAYRGARHALLHRQHVPERVPEPDVHRPPWVLEPRPSGPATTWCVCPLDAQGKPTGIEPFMSGLRDDGNSFLGRPTDVHAAAATARCSSRMSRWGRSTASATRGKRVRLRLLAALAHGRRAACPGRSGAGCATRRRDWPRSAKCGQCHGADGSVMPDIPSLAGHPASSSPCRSSCSARGIRDRRRRCWPGGRA